MGKLYVPPFNFGTALLILFFTEQILLTFITYNFPTILSQLHIFLCILYSFVQLCINVRPDLVPTALLHSYWRFCVQSDYGHIQPKHVAGLHTDKVVCRL